MTATEPAKLGRIVDRLSVIDIDSHITEPADLWTSRVSSRWGDRVPHVAYDERNEQERWYVGDRRLPGVGTFAIAGWREFPPSHPPTFEEIDRAAYDPYARIAKLDQFGIHAQVIYPNILGFYSHVFAAMEDVELANACVRAYNDFLADFCDVAPDRLVPLMMLPFWDPEASLREMEYAAARGHRGVVFGTDFTVVGLPELADEYWDPIFSAAQDMELSINFHIGFATKTEAEMRKHQRMEARSRYAKETVLFMLGNANSIAEIITSGICHRYPRLKFVSVESGAGWLPFFLASLDWQWLNSGAHDEMPERFMPSDYFRRQIYGSFWFETTTALEAILAYPDNIMFETDFPHPTSLVPGPCSYSEAPADAIERTMATLPDPIVQKVLHDNAAGLYRL